MAKKKSEPAPSQEKSRGNIQIRALILFALGLLFIALALVPGSNVWYVVQNFLYGIFSFGVFFIGPLLILIAVISSKNKSTNITYNKIWQVIILIMLICSAAHIFNNPDFGNGNFTANIGTLYNNGTSLIGGGLAGALLGWPLVALCGNIGAAIIIIISIFTMVMIITGSTLIGFFNVISKPVKKIGEGYSQHLHDNEQKKKAFDIEAYDDFLPDHPVSSRSQTDVPPESSKNKKKFEVPEFDAEPTQNKNSESAKNPPFDYDEIVSRATKKSAPVEKPTEKPAKESSPAAVAAYSFPPVTILKPSKRPANTDVSEELKANAARLVDTLKSFGVQTRIIDICRGPAVTRYELQPSAGVKISKITGLSDDIALNLASAGVRIEAPIPNKSAVGIEVPNKNTDIVALREIIDSDDFEQANSKVAVALGKDIAGNVQIADIGSMPHLLIAGSTGSGKSVCINSIIISLLYKSTPDEVRLLMIDPKVVELGIYNGIPHLLVPVVTDPRKAAGALGWAVTEMLKRYKLFAENGVRDIKGFNKLTKKNKELDPLPQIVIIIDELADLMMAAPNEVEDYICRLAQMARAAGMHLIIATQRPSVNVITGVIKANIPSRIAFAVTSHIDSRTILDSGGAEKLLGRGDMLFYPVGLPKPIRVQGCFVTENEAEQVINHIKAKDTVDYDEEIIEEIDKQTVPDKASKKIAADDDQQDDLFDDAVELVIEAGEAAASTLQRRLKIGYARAGRLVDIMEQRGIVGEHNGSKPRKVLISRQQWLEIKLNKAEEGNL